MGNNKNQDNQNKTDWSLAEAIMTENDPPSTIRDQVARTVGQGDLVLSSGGMPSTPNVGLPDSGAGRSILTKWRENKLGRKATLQALDAHYGSQLEALKYNLTKAVQVQKARADVIAEEYLKELDARQLEMLAELGLRNKDTREKALMKLTDTTSARIKEVQEKDWPEPLIKDVIDELFKLRKRVVSEIMKELGGDHSDD